MKPLSTPTTWSAGLALRRLAIPLMITLLAQCSAPVSVRSEKPVVPAGAIARKAGAELQLAAIHHAYQRILHGDDSAIPAYNYGVARLIEDIERSGADPWSAPIAISGAGGVHRLSGRAPEGVDPIQDRLIPTDTLKFKGEDAQFQSIVPGIGSPLVAVAKSENLSHIAHEVHRKKLPLRNLTAIIRFEGGDANMELIDPYQEETISLGGRRRSLAANYGAAVMLGLSKARVDKLGIARLLRPSRYNDTVHLNFLQPYDPKRIPVLFVHGFNSTPATFAPMYFELLEDPKIRERYQFWAFSYPSGYPYPYSASLLRKQLKIVDRAFPDHKDMVVIGHSMGSMITRTLVTDAHERIWREVFGKPVSETPVSGPSRGILEESLVFDSIPGIKRVIFISAPHRGSDLALDWFASLFSKLVRLPGTMADIRDAIVSYTVDPAAQSLTESPNSIDTLKPTSYFVIAINKIPIRKDITYHSIIGDRGKGDSPNSSDGVVPYWSSHLAGAASEKIVPSGHSAHQNPEGIEEVQRILLLNN